MTTGSVSPSGGTYDEGEQVTLVATPAQYYKFNGWSGDASVTSDHLSITMDSNKNIVASFVKLTYSVQTQVDATGGGTVDPPSGTFEAGTTVTITATSAGGYRFDHWTGDVTGTSSAVALLVDSDKAVTAHFIPMYAAGQLKIGDYVQFGQYAGKPILWRVIEDSANPDAKVGDVIVGDALLFSDKIVCQKPFDAAGPHDNNTERLTGGSSLWQTSNLRAWLNSSAEAGAATWPCGNPPTVDSVTSNDYAGEKGFLADGDFTEYERSLIQPVTQKSLLYYVDSGLAEGGSTGYDYGGHIDTIVANYDSAWYQKLTDRVFLLDPKQVNGVYNRFGSYYNNGMDDYWLRAPDSAKYVDSSAANVLYIRGSRGDVLYCSAKSGTIGVRPALMLSLKSVVFISGDGSSPRPYAIAGH